ncbi:hypothetical protein DV736_g6174, partial [Chaetothyriales sp. CBS 134916]
MSAAEFYATGPVPGPQPQHRPSASYLGPANQPLRASSHPNVTFASLQPQPGPQFNQTPPYPVSVYPTNQPQHMSPPPPPYHDEQKPSVHFTPPRPPTSNPPRHSFSGQRPPPNQFLQSPPQQYGPPALYNPQYYGNQQRPSVPHMQPYVSEHYAYSDSSFGGYSSDPEPHRRRHRYDGYKTRRRRISDTSRSANADAFIGAAGGGLIGDLIFPGLGTVGGVLAGWLGGKDYGERRKWREQKLEKEQEEWERRFSKHDRKRSRSRS